MSTSAPKVRDLMTQDVVTLAAEETLSLADKIMTLGRIRHMPVVDAQGKLIGLVSQRDLFRGALARALGFDGAARQQVLAHLRADEVMATKLVTTTADAPLATAAAIMFELKIGCLPVLDGDRLVGILTEADFVKLAIGA